jgi:hypothetical protein
MDEGAAVAYDSGVISPELALVDPELARVARLRLPPPSPVRCDGAARAVAPATALPRRRLGRRAAPPLVLLAAALGIGAAADLTRTADDAPRKPAVAPRLLWPVEARPAAAVPTPVAARRPSRRRRMIPGTRAKVLRPAASSRPSKPRAAVAPVPPPPRRRAASRTTGGVPGRSFSWAPVRGAGGYEVEIFHGSVLVFRGTTRRPQIVVPDTALQPGSFRWYVWPEIPGRPRGAATVRAKVLIDRT